MNILISNDDGINAKGMEVLARSLAEIPENNVYIFAPDGQRSATGHGITTGKPIAVTKLDSYRAEEVKGAYTTSGTPADCVKIGIKLLKKLEDVDIDIVFAGINHGSNIGTDVFYSGTVSAAAEGVFSGVPAVSVSVGTHHPTDEQLENCSTLIKELYFKAVPKLEKTTVLNVNFPDTAPSDIKGIRTLRLGPREYDEEYNVITSPWGQDYVWYSGNTVVYDELPEYYDVLAHQDGYISITPLKFDVTDNALMDTFSALELKY